MARVRVLWPELNPSNGWDWEIRARHGSSVVQILGTSERDPGQWVSLELTDRDVRELSEMLLDVLADVDANEEDNHDVDA